MKIKYAGDYMDKLSELYPHIERKDLMRLVSEMFRTMGEETIRGNNINILSIPQRFRFKTYNLESPTRQNKNAFMKENKLKDEDNVLNALTKFNNAKAKDSKQL